MHRCFLITPVVSISNCRRSGFHKIVRRCCFSPSRAEAEEPPPDQQYHSGYKEDAAPGGSGVVDERGGASKAATTTFTISSRTHSLAHCWAGKECNSWLAGREIATGRTPGWRRGWSWCVPSSCGGEKQARCQLASSCLYPDGKET